MINILNDSVHFLRLYFAVFPYAVFIIVHEFLSRLYRAFFYSRTRNVKVTDDKNGNFCCCCSLWWILIKIVGKCREGEIYFCHGFNTLNLHLKCWSQCFGNFSSRLICFFHFYVFSSRLRFAVFFLHFVCKIVLRIRCSTHWNQTLDGCSEFNVFSATVRRQWN